ncbi:MAG: metallophosphoesterase [Candidatus Aenigmatarchaeota archaeon]
MTMKFLPDRALLLPGRILVVADLHIGLERELAEAGIHVPSQVGKIQKRIDTLITQTKARTLVILGDVKHQVPTISWQEMREVPEFLEHLLKNVRVIVVKGNHDGDIERLAPVNVEIYEPTGFAMGEFALVHGQAWPDKKLLKCKTIVLAHIHPAIEFVSGGYRAVEHCWLRCPVDAKALKKRFKVTVKLSDAIIMPAFNKLIGGVAVNSKDFEPIGPLLRSGAVKLNKAEAWLTDGTAIGNLHL